MRDCCRYREQRDRPDLALPETHQLYLETRFEQLKVLQGQNATYCMCNCALAHVRVTYLA